MNRRQWTRGAESEDANVIPKAVEADPRRRAMAGARAA
jgi:hypothetical protein